MRLATSRIGVVAALALGCSPTARHRVLTFFFDGVPPLAPPAKVQEATQPGAPRPGGYLHGPYAARLCNACHERGTNGAFVAPREELCRRCHDSDSGARYEHGPYAAGACVECHDAHGSRYRGLLVAKPAQLCPRCHELGEHEEVGGAPCTDCHEAHTSNEEHLLW